MAHILVTGSSSGIGHATALHLARLGHTVHAGMRDPVQGGDRLRLRAEDEGLDLHPVALDVTGDASVADALEAITQRAGPVDVLVNNAGIARLGTIEESPLEWLEQTLATNVTGLVRMTRAVLPSMRERSRGTVVNVGSVAGRIASAVQGHYCASKFAVRALTESLAQEVRALGVHVVLIDPGFVATPILDKVLGVPPGSLEGPYAPLVSRRIDFFREGAREAIAPDEVAATIAEAVADPARRFAWIVPESARDAVAMRESVSDEEWIARGSARD